MTALAIIAAVAALAYAAVANDRRRQADAALARLRGDLDRILAHETTRDQRWERAIAAWEDAAVQFRATRAALTAMRADAAGTTVRIADPRRERLAARAHGRPGPERLSYSSTVTSEHPPLVRLTGQPAPTARGVLLPA